MAINTVVDPNLNLDGIAAQCDKLKPQGFRLISLSMYGDPKDARYAAVWDKRGGPEWEHAFGFTTVDLMKVTKDNKARNFYPRLIAATGGSGSKCRMSATFEKLDPPRTRELDFSIAFEFFEENVRIRRNKGWILVSASVYDDPKSAPMVAAVWGRNSANTAWTAFAETEADLQPHFEVQRAGWARLAFTTSSLQGKFVSLYRDDHVGKINKGVRSRALMSRDDLDSQKADWLKEKLHIICLQGSGSTWTLSRRRKTTFVFVRIVGASFRAGSVGSLTGVCHLCKVLYFDGSGASPKKCPATSKKHQHLSKNYSLVKDSPFDEHQLNWHRCKKCQGLFHQGKNPSVCPAGGSHEDAKSGEYSLAFKK